METVFTNIANAIRDRFGITGTITPLQFGNKINGSSVISIPTTWNYETAIQAICEHTADAIRDRAHITGYIAPVDMPDKIRAIPSGTWTGNQKAYSGDLHFTNYKVETNGYYTFSYTGRVSNAVSLPSGAEITNIISGEGTVTDWDSTWFTVVVTGVAPETISLGFGSPEAFMSQVPFTITVTYSYWK